ncbi:MAG TPA: hypothetical protein VFZ48_00715 [Candidatus Saccharimonadales bacterium]
MSEHYNPEQYHYAPKPEEVKAERPPELTHEDREALLRNQLEMVAAVRSYGAATAEVRQQALTQENFVLAS